MKWFYIFSCVFLSSCALIDNSGSYVAIDNQYNVFGTNSPLVKDTSLSQISVPFSDKKNTHQNILFKLGLSETNNIGESYGIFFLTIIPFPYLSGEKLEKDNRNLSVFLSSNTIRDDIKFSLKVENKIYKGEFCRRCDYQTNYNTLKPYYKIAFPLTVKNMGKKEGIIIIEYKGIQQEVPFQYKRRWRYWMLGDK